MGARHSEGMEKNSARDDRTKLAELIKDIRVAMLISPVDQGTEGDPGPGGVHVRPMHTQHIDTANFDGELWFFTDADSQKARDINADAPVLLTYADAGKNRFVSVQGRASIEQNPAKAQELWNVHAKGWWPEGPNDPRVRLIRVRVTSAEYWDGPSNISYMLHLALAVVTGERVETKAEHEEIRVR